MALRSEFNFIVLIYQYISAMLQKDILRFIQRDLIKRGWLSGKDDGIFGKNSQAALAKETRIPPPRKDWDLDKKLIGYVQLRCYDCHLNPKGLDGIWGNGTEAAYKELVKILEPDTQTVSTRPGDYVPPNPNKWPSQDMAEMNAFYGKIGDESQLTYVDTPYPMKLAWDKRKTLTRFRCNKKVAESIKRVLTKVLSHYGQDKISELGLDLWGGCHNIRVMRGGTKASMHSWAIAIDFDPARNQLQWGRDRAAFAAPDYEYWWQCWEEEGWVSLGRARNFDWMHVQAARLPNY